jgi:hypothetical protein
MTTLKSRILSLTLLLSLAACSGETESVATQDAVRRSLRLQ